MPTILQERGFRIMIYLNDHMPPHVHVWKAGKEARIVLSPVELWDSDLSPSETRQAVAIVEANRDTLLAHWQEIHGDDDGIALNNRRPVDVTFTEDDVIVTLSDGTKVSNPLAWHGWLEQAVPEQRRNYILGSVSILWPDLDEGLDIEGMLRGIQPKQSRPVTE